MGMSPEGPPMKEGEAREAAAGAKCRVAFVGAGSMAREHARALGDIPGVELVGIHSRRHERAAHLAREMGIHAVCDSIDELYETTGADLVVAAVPIMAMYDVANDIFRFPWVSLLEKPVGHDVAEAQEIADLAVRRGHRAYAALNRRFYGSTLAALKAIELQPGQRFIEVTDQQSAVAARAAGHPEPVVANWMHANSIHTIDYFRMFGRGAVTRVQPLEPWKPESPGIVLAHISFDSGDVGLYQGIWDGPGPWAVTVSTPGIRWEMRPLEEAAYQLRDDRQLYTIQRDSADKLFKPGMRRQAEEAIAAARGCPTSLGTITDALATMRLTDAIFASSVTEKRV